MKEPTKKELGEIKQGLKAISEGKVVPLSHTVNVKMIADQEIEIQGVLVNIHSIQTIIIDSKGLIINAFLVDPPDEETWII